MVGLLFCQSAAVHADEQTYEVAFDRPYAVGERYVRWSNVTVSQQSTFTMEGQPPRRENRRTRADVEAVAKVLEVNRQGQPESEVLIIRRARYAVGDGDWVQAIEPGLIVLAKHVAGKTLFRPQTGRLSAEGQTALQLAVTYADAKAATLQQQLGPNTPVAVGETWSASSTALAKTYEAAGLSATPEQVQAKVTLTQQVEQASQPCLKVTVDGNATGMRMQTGPPVQDVSMSYNLTFFLPVDTASRYRKQEAEVKINFTNQTDQGVKIQSKITRQITSGTSAVDSAS